MNTQTKHLKGFTIIEVVLVLAIAALIFLMVFIALPALQANQRDTERKQDASIVASAITKYVSGEREALPYVNGGTAQTDLRGYVEDLSTQFPNQANSVFLRSNRSSAPNANQIFAFGRSKCDGPDVVAGSVREAAVLILLDNGEQTYCIDA